MCLACILKSHESTNPSNEPFLCFVDIDIIDNTLYLSKKTLDKLELYAHAMDGMSLRGKKIVIILNKIKLNIKHII